MTEPRYTLGEARVLLARQECEWEGHKLEVHHLVKTAWVAPRPGNPGGWHCSRGCGLHIAFTYPEDGPVQ